MRWILALIALVLVLPLPLIGSSFGEPSPASTGLRHLAAFNHSSTDHARGDDDDDDDDSRAPFRLRRWFRHDPQQDADFVIAGEAAARLQWNDDAPAFPGDVPGSLTARYDSALEAGLAGYNLPTSLSEQDPFVAAFVFVIESDGFNAPSDGFFQISFGLWNQGTTGLNRTGNLESFAGDTFELIELNYFPAQSPTFGGPFLGPAVFGVEATTPPDSFANASFVFGVEAELPRDTPLLALLEHRPGVDGVVLQVHRLGTQRGRSVPLNRAVAVANLGNLSERQFQIDTVGLTLWSDGFGGPTPALVADVTFHAWVVRTGRRGDPLRLLRGR